MMKNNKERCERKEKNNTCINEVDLVTLYLVAADNAVDEITATADKRAL
jgi:hypothetical protein